MVTRLVSPAQREAELEQAVMDAQKASEPGTLDTALDNRDAMSTVELESAGWMYLWDTLTGLRSRINRNMLRSALRKRRDDGTQVYTPYDPKVPQPEPTFLCILHKDHPDRPFFDQRRSVVCRKVLMSEEDQESHIRHRHQREWRMYEAAEKRRIDEEERVLRRLNIESLTRLSPSIAGTVAEANGGSGSGTSTATVSEPCPDCGETLTAKPQGMHLKRFNHRKKFHGG